VNISNDIERILRWRQSIYLFIPLVFLIAAVSDVQAGVMTPQLKSALQDFTPDDNISVIVTLSDRVDISQFKERHKGLRRARIIKALRKKADVTQVELQSLLKKKNAKQVKSLWLINGMAVTAKADVIRELAEHPLVKKIRLDRAIPLSELLPAAAATVGWNIDAIRASELWDLGYQGQGAVVASMDTGVDPDHPDLTDRWRGGSNSWFDPNDEHVDRPYDATGHGTQTMGLIVGGDAGGTAIGAAPGAKWIAVKIFSDAGIAFSSHIHEGFEWLLDPDGNPDTDDAPDIVNNSWGFDDDPNECPLVFQSDIQVLKAAGIAVVFSAGNGGPDLATSISPANYPEAFAVGMIDELLEVGFSSSRGPSVCDATIYPEVVAPGVLVYTSDLTFGGVFPNSYVDVSGTSFAASHATGVMALLVSAFPDLNVAGLEDSLKSSALDINNDGPDNDYGNGLIDAVGAFDSLDLSGLAPCVRPAIDFTADPYPGSIDEQITFISSVSGGNPPYTYAWDVDGDGVTDCDTPECTHSYPAIYEGTVGLTVTDDQGCSAKLFISDAWAVCTPIAVDFAVDPNPAETDEVVTLISTVSGGNPPYTYAWDVDGDGVTDCDTPDCTHSYPTPYDGDVELIVTDSRGCSAERSSENVTVVLLSEPSNPPNEGVAPTPFSEGGSGGGGGGCFISSLAGQYATVAEGVLFQNRD
jgi:bacillopeptidase F